MRRRLICPRSRDEPRVGSLVDALEASVGRGLPPLRSDAPVPDNERSKLNFFHSQRLPKMRPRQLMVALVKARIAFDWTTVAIAVSLVQRYRRIHGSRSVTPHMLHRLLVGCLVVGAKAQQDHLPTNRLVAGTIGMPRVELARIEAHVCYALAWRVQVDHDNLVRDEAELCGGSVYMDSQHLASCNSYSSAASDEPALESESDQSTVFSADS